MSDLSQFFINKNIFEDPAAAYGHFAISEDGCLGVIDGHRKLDDRLVFLGTKIDTSVGADDLWISILPRVLSFTVSPDRIANLADILIPENEEDESALSLAMLPPGLARLLMAKQAQAEEVGMHNMLAGKPPIPGMLPSMSIAEAEAESEEFPLSLILRLLPSGRADIQLQSSIAEEDLTDELREFIDYVTNWVRQMNSNDPISDSPDLDDLLGEEMDLDDLE